MRTKQRNTNRAREVQRARDAVPPLLCTTARSLRANMPCGGHVSLQPADAMPQQNETTHASGTRPNEPADTTTGEMRPSSLSGWRRLPAAGACARPRLGETADRRHGDLRNATGFSICEGCAYLPPGDGACERPA